MSSSTLKGLFAAVLTPMRDDRSCDLDRLAAHCKALIERGCHGVSLFGTTGEGPSLSVEERKAGLDAVLAAGIAPDRILPGTGCAALTDAVALTRHAVERGCRNTLVMPPFFFKDVPEDGVVDLYARLIDGVGSSDLRVYIYNFPAVTGVWVREDAIARLRESYPGIVVGVKDSSGDWGYVTALLERFPGLAVFTGHETLVPRLVNAGGAGNVSGMANLVPELLREVYDRRPPDNDPLMAGMAEMVEEVLKFPLIPAIKAVAADLSQSPEWRNVRPPLTVLDETSRNAVVEAFRKARDKTQTGALTG